MSTRNTGSHPALRPVLATAVVAGIVYAGSVAFSPRCVTDTPCVTLSALRAGAPLPEAVHILDRNGAPIADVAGPVRWALPEERIPTLLAEAFVAVEDRRFREHEGIDARGVGRALFRNLAAGRIEEGASTIPMQLVRTLWGEGLRNVGPWRRKIIEARTAPILVERLGHRRVLTLYLNAIYLGNGLYGVEAASRYYFGAAAENLNLAQMATLVGMTQSPEQLEPRRHPEPARARRDVVLDLLADAGLVSVEEARRAKAEPLITTPTPPPMGRRSHLTAAVTRELRDVAPELAGRPGLRVITTIDPTVQAAGAAALEERLALIERGAHGRFSADSGDVLEGAALALDPATGAVRAWVGGRDFERSEFDRAGQARRQVGSLIKPFIVASALEQGVGILDLVSTLGDPVEGSATPPPWMPADHVEEPVLPIREALVRSSNRAAVNLGTAMGFEAVRAVGRHMGIGSRIPDMPSSFIGAFEASLLEMVGAYAAFGNGGVRVAPHLIERIERADGTVLWTRPVPGPVQALDSAMAYVVLDALRDVVDRGTGASVRATGLTGPAAGKTGTTDDSKDAWFIGLVPGLAAGVWIGFDRPRPIVRGGSGGTLAAPAWGRWMRRVRDSLPMPEADWSPPHGVRSLRYDPTSGERAAAECDAGPAARFEVAFVLDAEYPTLGCPGSLGHWLRSFWRAFAPRPQAPVITGHPRPRRPGG